jgi:hypothetical protein
MTTDFAVLGIAVAVLLLALIDRGIWFDRCMGALLIFGGVYLFFVGAGVLPGRRPTAIPYPALGTFAIVQGIALGIFHVQF